MRARTFILFLLVFLLASGYVFDSPRGEEQSEEIEEEQGPYFWDFGQVSEGEILEHTFVLKNDSPVNLLIKRVRTSCGCTTSEIKKKEIPAGGDVDIQVKFNTRGYSGIKKQFVYIHTDQQDHPVIKLTLKADIHPAPSTQ